MSTIARLLVPAVLAVAAIVTAAPALAYPPVAQPGAACPPAAGGAAAARPEGGYLQCLGGQWAPIDDAAARGDRWLTYGSMLELSGPAQPNHQLAAGKWVAEPLDTSTRCSILQVALVHPPNTTVPQLSTGKAGRQLTVEIQPRVATGQLSGNCLWQRQP